MKFGPVPPREAKGATAAHSVRAGERVVKKGTVIGDAEIAALERAGIKEIIAARLEPGDVPEDEAAASLAKAVAGEGINIEDAFTGRANLYAKSSGVLLVDRSGVDRLNRIDESVTFATLPEYKPVRAGEMIATVKIIPFAISGDMHKAALAAARRLVSVASYKLHKVGVISTKLPSLADKVIEKTVRITAERLKPADATIHSELRVPHETGALVSAIKQSLDKGAELVVVFGASAIADRRDVIPVAIEQAGGRIEHFGMPVDPGNLLLLGSVGNVPVIGAPGCARSPKENGFDWLLARLLAGLPVKRADVTGLGVGGLLMEIVTRPQPRAEPPSVHAPRAAVIVLAAGRGTRMASENKLAADLGGKPIIRHAVEAALASRARPIIVVTGHEPERVKAALKGLQVTFVHNPDFVGGLSTSLKAGISALSPDIDTAAILLGDMPQVSGALVDKLIAMIDPERGALIAVPTREGKRGNPVAWARRLFDELTKLEGDVGARHLIGANSEAVVEVPVEDQAAFLDIDTPEALAQARAGGKTMKQLQDRVAIVTGANSGLGRAIAETFAAEGAKVVLAARRKEALDEVAAGIKAKGGTALAVPTDVTKEPEVIALFKTALDAFGGVDILVNNAGIARGAPIEDLTLKTWQELIDVNLTAAFLCSREAVRTMKGRGGGRIINMASISARAPRQHSAAYTTSKYALEGLTRSLTFDGRAYGVVASVIHPGAVATGFTPGAKPGPGKTAQDYLMDPADVARIALLMCTLPPEVNLFDATILPNQQPSFLGRG